MGPRSRAVWCVLCAVLQVVSRAHRMGAVAPVHVELLAMKHTAEEHMVALRWGGGLPGGREGRGGGGGCGVWATLVWCDLCGDHMDTSEHIHTSAHCRERGA
jgi:hypothetical protein